MNDAATAIASLDKASWSKTTASERLDILFQIQNSLVEYQEELGAAESAGKNAQLQDKLYDTEVGKPLSVVPVANNVGGAIELYQAIISGQEFKPAEDKITRVDNNNSDEEMYDITVAPRTLKEKLLYLTRSDRIRVLGKPVQKGPYDKESKIVAVLGAGNYSSPLEIIKAVFFDGYVVAYKPHPLNEEIMQTLWAKIMQPLVDAKALAFCAADQGPALVKDARVDLIYFTGGFAGAQAIIKNKAESTVFVSECGGVNPALIVPGERPWTDAELAHHAQQIVSIGKLNGGAICGRTQLVLTCKNWPQRDSFLQQLERAITDDTYAVGSYYPGWKERMAGFEKAYPDTAKRLQPENGIYKDTENVLVKDCKEDSYAAKNEAFCQVIAEVPLSTENNAKEFLDYAVDYSNGRVAGGLCAFIVIDETTRKNNENHLQKAITNLRFGNIGVNLHPIHMFPSPYLAWCGHDDEKTPDVVVSGRGNFGNLYGFQNIQKNIFEDAFVSPGQFKYHNKAAIASTLRMMSEFSVNSSWWSLCKFLGVALYGSMKSKDW